MSAVMGYWIAGVGIVALALVLLLPRIVQRHRATVVRRRTAAALAFHTRAAQAVIRGGRS